MARLDPPRILQLSTTMPQPLSYHSRFEKALCRPSTFTSKIKPITNLVRQVQQRNVRHSPISSTYTITNQLTEDRRHAQKLPCTQASKESMHPVPSTHGGCLVLPEDSWGLLRRQQPFPDSLLEQLHCFPKHPGHLKTLMGRCSHAWNLDCRHSFK